MLSRKQFVEISCCRFASRPLQLMSPIPSWKWYYLFSIAGSKYFLIEISLPYLKKVWLIYFFPSNWQNVFATYSMMGYRQFGLYATWVYLVINQFMLGRELRDLKGLVLKLHEKMKVADARFSTHQIQVHRLRLL